MSFSSVPCGLFQRRLILARIDIDQRIALLDVLPFVVIHSGDDTLRLRRDGSGIDGRDGSDCIQVNADISLGCSCCGHGNRPGHAGTPTATAGARAGFGCLRFLVVAHIQVHTQNDGQHQKRP